MEHLGITKDEEVSVHIAPMIDVTNRHFRYFMRLLTRRAVLWTEMVKDDAILYSLHDEQKMQWLMGKHDDERRVVCQLGGSDPARLAEAAHHAERLGYDEVNLNVGCPSSRVCGKGEFGASLMLRAEVVRDCVHQMQRRVDIPVTVKTRLGVDNHDSLEFTQSFIDTVAAGGCKRFYMHARKAWLKGLSPAENRTVPPLDYKRVTQLCEARPDLLFCLNGGLDTLEKARDELVKGPSNLTGVMLGRAALNHPASFAHLDTLFYGDALHTGSRHSILVDYKKYVAETVLPRGDALAPGYCLMALKPCQNFFHNYPGVKIMRQSIENRCRSPEWRAHGAAHVLQSTMDSVAEKYPRVMQLPLVSPDLKNNNFLRNRLMVPEEEAGEADAAEEAVAASQTPDECPGQSACVGGQGDDGPCPSPP
eukprot:Rhum_TRINITY_DN4106_c0_g1::Rhum_TRINITY_DN4106_c0_g1_i1::g.12972::m.12972/K05539/dusA; tRNA-dihydrouridine synthase A